MVIGITQSQDNAIVKYLCYENRYVGNFPGRLWGMGLKFPELQGIKVGFLDFQSM